MTNEKNTGTLFVVATPIGNLEDMTPRAVRTLREVSLVAAEDTRRTLALLTHFGIKNRLLSLNADAERGRIPEILAALESGKDVAVVTDAGTPSASDPGGAVVAAAVERGFKASPIPGASAVIAAISVAGATSARFSFEGFIPRSGRKRKEALARIISSACPVVFFESPNRAADTMHDLKEAADSNRRVVLLREMTKKFEESISTTLDDIEAGSVVLSDRGEYTIVVMNKIEQEPDSDDADLICAVNVKIDAALKTLTKHGLSGRDAASAASEILDIPRKTTYERVKILSNIL